MSLDGYVILKRGEKKKASINGLGEPTDAF